MIQIMTIRKTNSNILTINKFTIKKKIHTNIPKLEGQIKI
jgi:hypothetical protein